MTTVKHLEWSSFSKILKAVNYFHKRSILDVDWDLITRLKGFLKDVAREELAIGPVVEFLTVTT